MLSGAFTYCVRSLKTACRGHQVTVLKECTIIFGILQVQPNQTWQFPETCFRLDELPREEDQIVESREFSAGHSNRGSHMATRDDPSALRRAHVILCIE